MITRKSKGLYVHIPFCKKKCSYCDFFSVTNFDGRIENYIEALLAEADLYRNTSIDTLYIGGGTPSLLGKSVSRLIDGLKEVFEFELSEATIEVNPESATEEFLSATKDSGINRISIGVQSLSNLELQSVDRLHNRSHALDTIRLAREIGFGRISVDVMIGLPHQTKESLLETLETLTNLDVGQISAYCLSIEEGTPLSRHIPSSLPSTDKQVELFFILRDFLIKKGFQHVEISNFSKPGEEPIHNLNCWRGYDYIGLGAGASSFVDGVRFKNKCNLDDYIHSPTTQKIVEEELTEKEKAFDTAMLSLRMLLEGLDFNQLKEHLEIGVISEIKEILNNLVTKEMLIESDGIYRIKDDMVLKSNKIFQEFII